MTLFRKRRDESRQPVQSAPDSFRARHFGVPHCDPACLSLPVLFVLVYVREIIYEKLQISRHEHEKWKNFSWRSERRDGEEKFNFKS